VCEKSFEPALKNIKMSLLTKFFKIDNSEQVRKLSTNQSAGTKLFMRKKKMSFKVGQKNVKMSLLTKFGQNTIILSKFIVQKLSTNQSAGTKLIMHERW